MFELLNDWKAWSRAERAAVAALAVGLTLMAMVWVGV
jgi:hypothetical protein